MQAARVLSGVEHATVDILGISRQEIMTSSVADLEGKSCTYNCASQSATSQNTDNAELLGW